MKIMRNKSFVLFVLLLVILNSFLLAKDKLWFSIPDENCSNDVMYAFKWQSNPLNISEINGWNASLSFSPFGIGIDELNAGGIGIATDIIPFLNIGFSIDYLGSGLFSESFVCLDMQRQFFGWFSIATRFKTSILKIEDFGTKAFLNSDVFMQYEGFKNFLLGFKFVNLFTGNEIAGQNHIAGFGFRFKPDTSISTGFDVNFILGYFTSYSVNFSAKFGKTVGFEVSFATQPQSLFCGTSVNLMRDLTLTFYLRYNNYLAFSQTLGIIYKFQYE